MDYIITSTVEIKPQTIADLFTTAIESGDPVTGGWCDGIYLESPGDVAWDDEHKKWPWYANPNLYLDPDLRLKVVEVSDETSGATTDHMVSIGDIKTGLTKLAMKWPRVFQAIAREEYDAADADTFLQVVVFGQEVYA